MKIKIIIEYAGDSFAGWQKQPGQRTVQGELETALEVYLKAEIKRLELDFSLNKATTIETTASGRTDSGVHAKGQVVSFRWPEEIDIDTRQFVFSLNGITDSKITILSAEIVSDDFDARRSPHVKCYTYTLLLKHRRSSLYEERAWCVDGELDIPAMIKAARCFVGDHDFSSFRAKDCVASTTIRSLLLSEISRLDKYHLVYTVHGKGFLKQMIRTMIGTLVEVGRGQRNPESIQELLLAKDRTLAGKTAPAQGLTLEWVKY